MGSASWLSPIQQVGEMIWEITKPLHLHKGISALYSPFLLVRQPHSGKTGTKLTATSEHVIFLDVILTLSKGD